MVMNRRNVLVGIALVAVVSGLALGSGAFTQVEATRNVDLQTSGDGSALLQLEPGSGADGIVSYQSDDATSADLLQINQSNLNEDALTRFDNAINVTNGGGDEVELSVNGTDALDIQNATTDTSIAGPSNNVTLGPGESVELDVEIDLQDPNNANDNLPEAVTFYASST